MPERGFTAFLLESFAAMRREVPGAHAEVCRVLARRSVRIEVGGESPLLRFARGEVALGSGAGAATIEVRATKAAILDLVDARRTLVESVLGDAIFLRGGTHDLLVFHDGLTAYVHGAVRAPSFPSLLRDYRASGQAGPPRGDGDVAPSRELSEVW